MAITILAAGCFWGVEAHFRQIAGVTSTRVGYTAGTTTDPTYKTICTGGTGHAEAIEITFDESILNFSDLLNSFWHMHDPTTLNRQGPDIGTQYRSAIFYCDEQQKQTALKSKQSLDESGYFSRPIMTEITVASIFYLAEDYHQCYLEKKGLGSCH